MRDTGFLPGVDRVFGGQINKGAAGEAQLFQLPQFLGTQQGQDSNGALIFMVDLDALDGSNGLG